MILWGGYKEHFEWVDIAKGIAILFVVIVHIRGLYYDDGLQITIATLHDPTFFVVSGFLIASSINSDITVKQVIKKKINRLVIPFIIWILIYSITEYILLKQEISVIVLDYINKLWFLPMLFIGLIVTTIVIKFKIPPGIVFLLGIVLSLYFANVSSAITKIIMYILMVLLGANIDRLKKTTTIILLVITFWISSNALFISGIITGNDTCSASGVPLMIFLLSGACGALVLIEVSKIMSGVRSCDFTILKFLGKNTLYIYILHFIGLQYLYFMPQNVINGIIGISLIIMIPLIAILGIKKKW